MNFIKIGEEYYNELVISKVFTKAEINSSTGEEETHYFASMLGGVVVELTQEEYNDLIGGQD